MVSVNQIRQLLSDFLLHGDNSRFVSEFAKVSYNIHRNGEPGASELANVIESKLADLRGGFISVVAFKNTLRELAVSQISSTYIVSPHVTTCSSSTALSRSNLNWAVDWREATSIRFVGRQYASV